MAFITTIAIFPWDHQLTGIITRIDRAGRIVAIQTCADAAPPEAFSMDGSREERLDRAGQAIT